MPGGGAASGFAASRIRETTAPDEPVALSFGPVGLAGWGLLLLGILKRSRVLSLLGLGAVAADVTIAELGGFKAMNETRAASAPPD